MIQKYCRLLIGLVYQSILKPILFRFDAEWVHTRFTLLGEFFGSRELTVYLFKTLFGPALKKLQRTLHGIPFAGPVGLAAGFDYEARLTQITPTLGFGFHTIGTITNHSYQGNPRPMLARLPKSQSLLVNKGFKNPGADAIIRNLQNQTFAIPVGISVGRTNDATLSQEDSVKDIVSCFTKFEKARMYHSYYELNISCPNLAGDVTFYDPKELRKLLHAIDQLKLARPLFIKMPISQPNDVFEKLLQEINASSAIGVIIGNLQQDRTDPAFDKEEIDHAGRGNFSGRPAFARSNYLISLTRKKYKNRFTIIGCGGIFSPDDAKEKLHAGADLTQLITGMIFTGPQLIADINDSLAS